MTDTTAKKAFSYAQTLSLKEVEIELEHIDKEMESLKIRKDIFINRKNMLTGVRMLHLKPGMQDALDKIRNDYLKLNQK